MTVADARSIAANFPVLQTLEHQRSAEAAPPVDSMLLHLCVRLREDQRNKRRSNAIEPQDWESFDRDNAVRGLLVQGIAETPATSRIGLRAKALVLHALLDEGGGELSDDAAMPDVLAWSLVQDILAAQLTPPVRSRGKDCRATPGSDRPVRRRGH